MSFERARNDKNKKIRLEEIKSAAKKLFDEIPYHEINLSKIGNEINFTRANLYKYVSSKEEIYLYVFMDEIKEFTSELEKKLILETKLSTKTLSNIWATTLNKYPRFLKLTSILFTIIEQNCSVKTLIDFKNEIALENEKIFNIIKHNIPEFDDDDISKLLDFSFSLMISRYSICNPSDIQREACERSKFSYVFPTFVETFSESLIYLINGIKVSKL